jgi:PhoH-like ATPase
MKKIYILDTSVILEFENIIFSLGKNDVCIPIQVLEDLDLNKKGKDSSGENAREFIRSIDKFPPKKIFDGGHRLGDKRGKIRFIMNIPYHEDVANLFSEYSLSPNGLLYKVTDNQILNTVYHVTKEEENKNREVVLITKDINLRIKAKSLGLKAEDYVSEVSSMEKIYKKIKDVKIEDNIINNLHRDNPTFDIEDPSLKNNDFVRLFSSKKDFVGLGVYEDCKIRYLNKNLKVKGLAPRSAEQTFAIDALLNEEKSLVTLIGVAGTGKTLLSLAAGLDLVDNKKYDQVIYLRDETLLEDEDKLGFVPGDLMQKMLPYTQGLQDNIRILNKIDGKNSITFEGLIKSGKLSIMPTQYLRGRTLNGVFVINDEFQNSSRKTSKTVITRIGENSKIVTLGDIEQIDKSNLNYKSNGLSYLVDKMGGQKIHSHIYFKNVQRSLLSKLAAELL